MIEYGSSIQQNVAANICFYLEVWSAAARKLAGTHHRLAILFLIAGYWIMQSKLISCKKGGLDLLFCEKIEKGCLSLQISGNIPEL